MHRRHNALRRSATVALAVTVGAFVSVACSFAARNTAASAGLVRLHSVELAAEDPTPGGTYVIIENRTRSPVRLGCWRIRTGQGVRRMRSTTVVPAAAGLRLLFDHGDARNPDRIALINPSGRVVDATPLLNDTKNDDRSFTRIEGHWTLGRAPLPSRVVEGKFVQPGSSC